MSVVESLERLGGVATRAALDRGHRRSSTSTVRSSVGRRRRCSRAVDTRSPGVDAARGRRRTGSAEPCRWRSAALSCHGLGAARHAELPEVTVPRNRKVAAGAAAPASTIHRRRPAPSRRSTTVSTTRRADARPTACAGLPFDEALGRRRLGAAARVLGSTPVAARRRTARGPGSAADAPGGRPGVADEAANPFESALRAIARDVPGLTVRAAGRRSTTRDFLGRPDLVGRAAAASSSKPTPSSGTAAGRRLRARRQALQTRSRCAAGWCCRFAWEDVMFDHAPGCGRCSRQP